MAKFSFADAEADADEDHPPAPAPATATATADDKRKRDGSGPDDAADGGPAPKARKLAAVGGERAVAGDGREIRLVDGDGDTGISMRIDPDLLDCSICFEPLCPPLYQETLHWEDC